MTEGEKKPAGPLPEPINTEQRVRDPNLPTTNPGAGEAGEYSPYNESIRRQADKIARLQLDLDEARRREEQAQKDVKLLEIEIHEISDLLGSIKNSAAWKVVRKFRRAKNSLLPRGTIRRNLYERLLARMKTPPSEADPQNTSPPSTQGCPEVPGIPGEDYCRAGLVALSPLESLPTGKMRTIRVGVTNLSPHKWLAADSESDRFERVRLSYHWRDNSGKIVQWEGERTPLPYELGPQGSVDVEMRIFAPFEVGDFNLEISLVHGRDGWFDQKGSAALRVPVRVQSRAVDPPPLPSCSILIPVFNRAAFTKSCLLGIERSIDVEKLPYEVIVVDNASTDGTADLLTAWSASRSNARVTYLGQNFGFARACNEGARLARGHYLLFLNNDTLPTPGWLEKMIGLAEAEPRIGIVGCKLLYPDGRIQHVGVAFGENRTPKHLYRGFPRVIPPANVRREYQAVTGACLLLRRELYSDVGGMDTTFRNSYEDMDLCLKVRARGCGVMVCSDSVVYHFEGMTEGRRAHDFRNAALFKARWTDQIEADWDRWHILDGLQEDSDEFEVHEGYDPSQERLIKTLWKRVYSCDVPEFD